MNRGGKEREKETEGGRDRRVAREKGDRREDWMGRAGSPIYKGEPGDYDLPFVRSFQLFCPIKISIFSPIAATLAGSPFAVSLTPPPPLPPLSTQATLHTVTSTMPNPVILPLLTLAHPVIQPPLSLHRSFFSSLSLPPLLFLSFSFFRSLISFNLPPLSLSLFSLCLHLRYSGFNIQLLARGYASARGPLAKSGKRSRLRFLRAHKRARVSLPSCGCRLTVRSRGGK